MSLVSMILTAVFFPAYVMNVAIRTAVKLPFMPLFWIAKKINPNIVDDINNRKNAFSNSIKDTADRSFMTMSSMIAK